MSLRPQTSVTIAAALFRRKAKEIAAAGTGDIDQVQKRSRQNALPHAMAISDRKEWLLL